MSESFHQNNVNLSYFLLLPYNLIVSSDAGCISLVKKI